MNNSMISRGFAAASFFISLVVYLLTMAPTVSFWDCGEFIACSYKMAVPHPPGAPFFLMLGRVFTIIPFFEDIAARVNLISVLSSAFTVLFLHLSIVYLVKDFTKDREGFNLYVPHFAGLIGALTFAFSHSFWFNAVEAEVYAPSMFFTGLVVWLAFLWDERRNEPGNEKYILMIAYIIGLALGVHLLNVLTIPMIMLIIFYRKYEVTITNLAILAVFGGILFWLIYPGIVKMIPVMISHTGFIGVVLLVLSMIAVLFYAVRARQNLVALVVLSMLLIMIGFSSYMMIYIRSGLNPNIDENNPETIEKFISYMNREQYGDHRILDREYAWRTSPNGKNWESATHYFWGYQVNHMYIRYFFWNFAGVAKDGVNVDFFQFLLIPLLLGLGGAYYHFIRDWKMGLAVFVLFFMTGLAIVLYLNQPDPQPRERDYSYVGSFFAFAIWVGIGAAGLLEKVTEMMKGAGELPAKVAPLAMALTMLIGGPTLMLATNYQEHDRTGNYVASDYSYNMLVSAETGGIMYTNGDNDTFPLWYLQEVENVRTDVRVANLSLLNTSWYIKQLRNMEPKVPMSLKDNDIDNLDQFLTRTGFRMFGNKEPLYGKLGAINLFPWPGEENVTIDAVADNVRRTEIDRYRAGFGDQVPGAGEKISFNLRPKHNISVGQGKTLGFLRVQDYMILNSLIANKFEKPVYFAVTTSRQNQMDGLQDYLRMDGLLFKITTLKGWSIDPETLYNNVMNKFRYRGLNDPDVYFNPSILGLVQNYRSAFLRLANYYLDAEDNDKFREVIKKSHDVMPSEVIPYTNRQFGELMQAFEFLAGVRPAEEFNSQNYELSELRAFSRIATDYKFYEEAKPVLIDLLGVIDENPEGPKVMQLLNRSFTRQVAPAQRVFALETIRAQLQEQLATTYENLGMLDKAIETLEERLKSNQRNNNVLKAKLQQLIDSQSADANDSP